MNMKVPRMMITCIVLGSLLEPMHHDVFASPEEGSWHVMGLFGLLCHFVLVELNEAFEDRVLPIHWGQGQALRDLLAGVQESAWDGGSHFLML